jgi:hypothetical protein
VRIVLAPNASAGNLPFFDPKSVTARSVRVRICPRKSLIPHFLVESDS